jgi:hypothetical protein
LELEAAAVAEDEEPEPEATLFDRPDCFNVVPANFFTSGTFSLILVLRVPISVHVDGDTSAIWDDSEPVGSMKI